MSTDYRAGREAAPPSTNSKLRFEAFSPVVRFADPCVAEPTPIAFENKVVVRTHLQYGLVYRAAPS